MKTSVFLFQIMGAGGEGLIKLQEMTHMLEQWQQEKQISCAVGLDLQLWSCSR